MERKTRAATFSGVFLAVIAGIVVLANVLSYGAYKRWDVTKNERFTLSQGSARLVREGLKQELQLDVYVTRGLPKYEAFIRDITDLLDQYEAASNGKMKYTVIEPKTDEERQAAKDAGLQELMLGEGSETGRDAATIARGYMGIVFKYGSEKDKIPVLSPESGRGLEFWISNTIREIRDQAEGIHQKIGVLTGKDEIKITDANLVPAMPGRGAGPSIRAVIENNFPFYKFEDVDLKGGDEEINKELKGLLITQPGKEFTEKELRRIDQFLMLGDKAIVVVAGAVNLKASDASMKGTLNTWGLEKLLDGYGVEMKKEAIFDWGQTMRIPVGTPTGQIIPVRAHGVVQLQRDDSLDEKEQLLDTSCSAFFRVDEISLPFPSTLVAHPEKQPEAKMKVVARSSPNSTVDDSETIDFKFTNDSYKAKGEYGQRAMAITLEGKIKSAFPGGDDQGIQRNPQAATDSRVLVISASQFLANPFARSGNPPPMPPQMMMMGGMPGDEELQMISQYYVQKEYLTGTIISFKNTLDFMLNDSTLLAASAKLLNEPNLKYSDIRKPAAEASQDPAAQQRQLDEIKAQRKTIQDRVQWTLILLPGLLFIFFGLGLWQLRERSREAISLD